MIDDDDDDDDDDACGAISGIRIGRGGEPKYSEKPAPVPFCPP
jgi:hypothetical protein